MKIKWRNKDLPHQLDVKFDFDGRATQIVAYCNCGQTMVRGLVVQADVAIQLWLDHWNYVKRVEEAKRAEQ